MVAPFVDSHAGIQRRLRARGIEGVEALSEEFDKTRMGLPFASASQEGSELSRPVGLVEVAGRVKWFDVAKGYGFIIPDNGDTDILIHVTVLRRDGFSTLLEGARVVAEAQRRSEACRCFASSR